MHWIDIICLMVIGFGSAAAYKRGLVLEMTDWTIGLVAGLAAFRGFRPFGGFIHRMIPGWPEPTSQSIAFWFLLLFVGIMVLSAGLHIDRATREYDRIPPEVRNYGGLAVGFVKCLVIASLLCAYLPYSDGLTSAEKNGVRRAMSAGVLRSLSAPINVIVSIVAPDDIARKYREAVK